MKRPKPLKGKFILTRDAPTLHISQRIIIVIIIEESHNYKFENLPRMRMCARYEKALPHIEF